LTGKISAGIGHEASTKAVTGAAIFELVVSVYGGYFGGGIGIMNLAMLSAMGMTDIHEMNALKVLLGGYASAHYAQKLPQSWIRGLVIVVGTAMTAYFFVRSWR
jgi:uncharacterized membrane protein YfcA